MKTNKTIVQLLFLREKYFNVNKFYGINNTLENNINFYQNKVNTYKGFLKELKKDSYINKHNKQSTYIYDCNTKILHTLKGDLNVVDNYIQKNNISNYIINKHNTINVYKNSWLQDQYIYMGTNQLEGEIKNLLRVALLELRKYKKLKKLELLSGKNLSIEKYNKSLLLLCKKANIKTLSDINFKIISKENKIFSINYKY